MPHWLGIVDGMDDLAEACRDDLAAAVAQARREALEEACAWQTAASVTKKLHYEGETTTPKVKDFVKYQIDARERAKL